MDEANEVTTTVYVQISDGTNNAGTRWHCTASINNLGVDRIHFVIDPVQTQLAPLRRVTLEYEAIDLHFEYMSRTRVARPRFLRNEYTIDGDGQIVIDPATGDKILLPIDSAIAQEAIVNTETGEVTFNQVAEAISESVWRDAVRYKGTQSRFEQTPAGPFWHVLETATVKIDPIIPSA